MEKNGLYFADLQQIKNDVAEIKDISHALDRLTVALEGLTSKFDAWIHVAEHSVPLKAVFWMILVMVFGMLFAMVGVEGITVLMRAYAER